MNYLEEKFTAAEASKLVGVNHQKIVTWCSRNLISFYKEGGSGAKVKLYFDFCGLIELELLKIFGEGLSMKYETIKTLMSKELPEFLKKPLEKQIEKSIHSLIRKTPSPCIVFRLRIFDWAISVKGGGINSEEKTSVVINSEIKTVSSVVLKKPLEIGVEERAFKLDEPETLIDTDVSLMINLENIKDKLRSKIKRLRA